MYKLIIKTDYNVIHLDIDDLKSPMLLELLEQPYIQSVKIEEEKVRKRVKKNEMGNKKDKS